MNLGRERICVSCLWLDPPSECCAKRNVIPITTLRYAFYAYVEDVCKRYDKV